MQGFFTGQLFVACLKRAAAAGAITGENLVKAMQSLKNVDVGGMMPPVSVVNNKVPVGRVYKGDAAKKVFVPVSDWIRIE